MQEYFCQALKGLGLIHSFWLWETKTTASLWFLFSPYLSIFLCPFLLFFVVVEKIHHLQPFYVGWRESRREAFIYRVQHWAWWAHKVPSSLRRQKDRVGNRQWLGNLSEDQSHAFIISCGPASSAGPALNLTEHLEVFHNHTETNILRCLAWKQKVFLRTTTCYHSVQSLTSFPVLAMKKKGEKTTKKPNCSQGCEAVLAANGPDSGSPPLLSCALPALRDSVLRGCWEAAGILASFKRDLTGGPGLSKSVDYGPGLSIWRYQLENLVEKFLFSPLIFSALDNLEVSCFRAGMDPVYWLASCW